MLQENRRTWHEPCGRLQICKYYNESWYCHSGKAKILKPNNCYNKRLSPNHGLFLFIFLYAISFSRCFRVKNMLIYERMRCSLTTNADYIAVNLIWPRFTRLTDDPRRGLRELQECENYIMLIPIEHAIARTV